MREVLGYDCELEFSVTKIVKKIKFERPLGELQAKLFEINSSFQVKGCVENIRVTNSNLRVTSSNPRVTSSNSRVTSSNSRVTMSNPRVTMSNLPVTSSN